VVETNDNIAEMPLEFQFESLLSANALKSVEWSGGPIVLIIDALDECGSEADRKILMQVLSKGFSTLPSFIRIMVVSRQEQDIQRVLGSHSHLRRYPLDIDSVTNKDDVLEYIRHRLEEIRIKNGRLGDHWPGEDKIRSLANRAGGLFIWASTACLYIESYAPNRRLSELVEKQPEGNSSGPFAQLDSLYETGLQSAGLWHDALFRSDCCNILGTILCARVPCRVLSSMLSSSYHKTRHLGNQSLAWDVFFTSAKQSQSVSFIPRSTTIYRNGAEASLGPSISNVITKNSPFAASNFWTKNYGKISAT
jgi:hypothetical protein